MINLLQAINESFYTLENITSIITNSYLTVGICVMCGIFTLIEFIEK